MTNTLKTVKVTKKNKKELPGYVEQGFRFRDFIQGKNESLEIGRRIFDYIPQEAVIVSKIYTYFNSSYVPLEDKPHWFVKKWSLYIINIKGENFICCILNKNQEQEIKKNKENQLFKDFPFIGEVDKKHGTSFQFNHNCEYIYDNLDFKNKYLSLRDKSELFGVTIDGKIINSSLILIENEVHCFSYFIGENKLFLWKRPVLIDNFVLSERELFEMNQGQVLWCEAVNHQDDLFFEELLESEEKFMSSSSLKWEKLSEIKKTRPLYIFFSFGDDAILHYTDFISIETAIKRQVEMDQLDGEPCLLIPN